MSGISNPLFFIGVVENNFDERLEGRVQVRAFGIHGTVQEVPTADLPWAVLCIGSHDVNFVVPPINSWVFGLFLDGRDAQQPMILGLIPTQMTNVVDPAVTGWGVSFGAERNLMAQGSRPQDAGQPTNSRLMRGESLEETYLLNMEVNRKKDISIAGGEAKNLHSKGNAGVLSQDDDQGALSIPDGAPAAYEIPKTERAEYIKSGLMRRGMPEHVADGFLMNMYDESKLDPGIEETALNVHGTRGYGLLQWTDTSNGVGRRTNLFNYAKSVGKPANDIDVQLDFMMIELNGDEKGGYQKVLKTTSGGEAGAAIVKWLQRPAKEHLDTRTAAYLGGTAFQSPTGVTATSHQATASTEAPKTASWEEPAPAYNAQYPYNRVIETAGGHSIEIDDTPGNERVMIWHRSGAYMQMAPTTTTHKAVGDKYSINDRNQHVYVGGTSTVTIEGDSHVLVKGDKVEEVMGNYRLMVHGNYEAGAGGQLNMNGGEEANVRAARVSMESNVENTNVKVGKVLRFETTETIHLKTKNMFFETAETLNITVGTDFMTNVAGKISVAADAEAYIMGSEVHIKGDDVRLGGGDAVNISASEVAIDDIVKMANGDSSAPEESGLTATAAESATSVTRPAPPSKSVSTTAIV